MFGGERNRGEMESGEHMGVVGELRVMEAPHFPVEPENSKRPLQQHPYNTPERVKASDLAWRGKGNPAARDFSYFYPPTSLCAFSLSLTLSIWEDVKKYNHA